MTIVKVLRRQFLYLAAGGAALPALSRIARAQALQQRAPELQAALDKAIAARKHAEAQTTLMLETYDQQVEFGSFGAVSQAAVDAAKRNLEAAVQSEADARAAEERARLELTSASGDGGTAVALLRQQLADAAN